ncbi:group II truncated hemoglobin [Glycomyces algeriensis]|uniref:Globin n=1 Tax=Glycomyces algeriensis TaxID=256037 RepID=A0A9W6G8Z2_9ACTN|nr:group II truncated hemoglobin [Glycomyces algeriensis]MDA1364767.1 group II truncated hemoglobin [Glycomyces algeriensis]MDR7350808.1 hemoglobin [Glycomyces algeriensis]GLI43519.1 globin [Glycomyces algeriensis]
MGDGDTTIYERIGGDGTLRGTVDAFYGSVLHDPVLQPLFGAGAAHHVDHLTAFLAEVFGGPARYTDELGGFDTLLTAHRGLAITDEQRARFIELFDRAVTEHGPADDELRASLHEYIVFGTEVAQVNSHAKGDDDLHPCQEVPHWP